MSPNALLAWFVLLMILVVCTLLYLALRSGTGYTVHDTKAHAERFADIIEEGHGGMTAFAWFTFTGIFIWCIVYLAIHWSEFSSVFFKSA